MINNPYFLIGDIYDNMKTKTENKVRYTTYFSMLWNTLLEMFTWENLPDTIPKRFLESILHSTGQVFIAKINEKLVASVGTLSGKVDAYGLGTDVIAVCPTGEARGIRNVDIAYGINNDSASPDDLIYWISHLLGETDKSIKTNVIYSRFLKIPKLRNDKDKNAFHDIYKKLINGEPEVFISNNVLDYEFETGTETFELTDVNKIDKLPYLTQFFEDALKRFYNFYGQPMQNQNKRAQSISDEIHGMDSVSFILPSQMLKCRQALADNINSIFGTDISVHFSELWELEYSALINRDLNNNGIADVKESSGSDAEPSGSDAEPSGTDAEPSGTDVEPSETDAEPTGTDAEPTDLPAMDLEAEKSINSKDKEVETEIDTNNAE